MQYNKDFIKRLMEDNNRVVHCRITSLNLEGIPQETLEGRTTAGSVNVDGASAVRRTCQLTLLTEQTDVSDYYWSLNTRIKLEAGLENHLDNQYPDIIWFNLGHYIITSFSQSLSSTGSTINISGKDKMCLLNGEVSGSLPFEVNFGCYEEIDKDGNRKIIKMPIPDIIREAVHHYANEPFYNIVISDLDKTGLILQEYRYDTPLYLIRDADQTERLYFNGTLYDFTVYTKKHSTGQLLSQLDSYDSLNTEVWTDGTRFSVDPKSADYPFCAAKIDFGETAGYVETELVYPDDLIANAGESITSVLDKIVAMLGDFEYFYDLDGAFVFRKKKTYINTSWTPIITTGDGTRYVDAGLEKYSYDFTDTKLFTAISNTPNIGNAKNDYAIWGNKKTDSGEIPIHIRYAIDEKPIKYTTIEVAAKDLKTYNEKHGLNIQGQDKSTFTAEHYDWRELIYQMARDYFKYNHLDDFEVRVANANPDFYPTGRTGYEQYYTDLEGFWRLLYNPAGTEEEGFTNTGWHKNVEEAPNQLLFWFDFLDSSGEINKYSVRNIGQRPVVKKDNAVRAIWNLQTPNVIFTTNTHPSSGTQTGVNQIQFKVDEQNFNRMFKTSTQGKSAKEAVEELIYKHAYCVENLTITALPIYMLEPNTLITIEDKEHGIKGDYVVNKISIPLSYNGTTSISATKAINRIL